MKRLSSEIHPVPLALFKSSFYYYFYIGLHYSPRSGLRPCNNNPRPLICVRCSIYFLAASKRAVLRVPHMLRHKAANHTTLWTSDVPHPAAGGRLPSSTLLRYWVRCPSCPPATRTPCPLQKKSSTPLIVCSTPTRYPRGSLQ